MRVLFRVPDLVRNPISLFGAAVALAAAFVFAGLWVVQAAGVLTNPYVGLVVFVALPAVFAVGLLLVPAGAWWSARRQRRGALDNEWPVLDLRSPGQRVRVAIVGLVTLASGLIVLLGAYGGVHYMESSAFCGQVCHTVMEPQAVAHRAWPHAAVECTACHIGPGAGASVEAKLAGVRQLWHVVSGQVPRPVPSRSGLVQPAAVTCTQCHSPALARGDVLREIREFADDEAVTETVTRLRLPVGDENSGIHRHIGLDIEYQPGDDTLTSIPIVRVRDGAGSWRQYVAEGAAPDLGRAFRRMDCTDCHNRPAHTFSPTPERAVDRAIARGGIPRALPFIRREAVAAVRGSGSSENGPDVIAARLRGFYEARPEIDAALLEAAIVGTQEVWMRNVFPQMHVTFGTYPSFLGHTDASGCFRCHDGGHQTPDGAVITSDCESCHTFPE